MKNTEAERGHGSTSKHAPPPVRTKRLASTPPRSQPNRTRALKQNRKSNVEDKCAEQDSYRRSALRASNKPPGMFGAPCCHSTNIAFNRSNDGRRYARNSDLRPARHHRTIARKFSTSSILGMYFNADYEVFYRLYLQNHRCFGTSDKFATIVRHWPRCALSIFWKKHVPTTAGMCAVFLPENG